MTKASNASGNAVLAKARALYGRRLRAEDYRRLMGCRTMSELAAALKEQPLYSAALADVNPSTPAAPSWKACCGRACTPAMTAFAGMTAAQAARCMNTLPSAVRWTS